MYGISSIMCRYHLVQHKIHKMFCTVWLYENLNIITIYLPSDPAYSMVQDPMINNPAYSRSTSAEQENKYVEATPNPLYSGTVDGDCPVQLDRDLGVYEIVQDRPLHT